MSNDNASPQYSDLPAGATSLPNQPTPSVQSAQPQYSDLPAGAVSLPNQQTTTTTTTPASPDTGIVAGVKRNTIGLIEGLYHAFTDDPTDQEKADIKAKIDAENQKYNRGAGAGPRLQFDPDNIPAGALAYHRLVDAPASMMNKKGADEIAAAQDLLAHGEYWKGGNQYLSGLADKGLSKVPLAGPAVGSIAQRAESGDVTGAATDVAAAWALENAGSLAKLPRNPFRKVITNITQGADVAQVPAEAATRAAVKTGGGEVRLATAQPASLRTIVEEPISTINGLKKGVYGQVDQAAGTDLKTLYDKLDNINDKIDLEASGSPEEARLEAQRTSQMQTIDDAKAQARTKGVDVDSMLAKGDALHTREMALRDFQKAFLKNVNIVSGNTAEGTPETMDVDSAVKAIQKLQDSTKFGAPRLEQALGKEGAARLRQDLYAAQRLGVQAIKTQKIAQWVAGIIGVPTAAAAYEGVKKFMQ